MSDLFRPPLTTLYIPSTALNFPAPTKHPTPNNSGLAPDPVFSRESTKAPKPSEGSKKNKESNSNPGLISPDKVETVISGALLSTTDEVLDCSEKEIRSTPRADPDSAPGSSTLLSTEALKNPTSSEKKSGSVDSEKPKNSLEKVSRFPQNIATTLNLSNVSSQVGANSNPMVSPTPEREQFSSGSEKVTPGKRKRSLTALPTSSSSLANETSRIPENTSDGTQGKKTKRSSTLPNQDDFIQPFIDTANLATQVDSDKKKIEMKKSKSKLSNMIHPSDTRDPGGVLDSSQKHPRKRSKTVLPQPPSTMGREVIT
jgi:hypothetical protein